MNMKYYGRLHDLSTEAYYNLQDEWKADMSDCYSYEEFIKYFRDLRYKNGISDIKY